MLWNWEHKDWPEFSFVPAALDGLEMLFHAKSLYLSGTYLHLNRDNKTALTIDLLSDEAYKTSEIEGEYLNRDSLRSSIRRCMGLSADTVKVSPGEQGIAEMMVNLYQTYPLPLTHKMLFDWHLMLTRTRRDLYNIGSYRAHEEPMQVVSGTLEKPKIHFEAPPSARVPDEMNNFVEWFNYTAPNGIAPLPALTRAAIAHLYFVSIHPFEDGNGRIARALVEKSLSQALNRPSLIALSHLIHKHKKDYYSALEKANKNNEISDWLDYFSKTILSAQDYTQQIIEFLIKKTRLFDRMRGQLNERQERVLVRIFQEGVEGFKGGLSAENYIKITKTSRATATRDLQDLVDKEILHRTGERRSTRYSLNLDDEE
jgi:Fic family protein